MRRLLVHRNPDHLEVPGVVRRAEPRHREVLVGFRALSLDPGGAGCFHQRGVPSDRALEAHEAPVVPVRRGELDRLVEQARVFEELAGHVDGVPGRHELHEFEHPPSRRLGHRRDREPSSVGVVRHQHADPARDGDHRLLVVGGERPDERRLTLSGPHRTQSSPRISACAQSEASTRSSTISLALIVSTARSRSPTA